MVYWKAWFDVRGRFFLSLAIVTLLVLPQAIVFASRTLEANRGEPGDATAAQEAPADERRGQDERGMMGWDGFVRAWYDESAGMIFAIMSVVLAVGGTVAESNARSNVLSLSLPVRRSRWLTARASMAILLTFALAAYVAVVLAAVALVFGHSFPMRIAVIGSLLVALSVVVWVGLSLLSTSLTRESVRAALLVVGVIIVLEFLGRSVLEAWSPWQVSRVAAWEGGAPWRSLFVVAVLGLGGAAMAVRRFERADY
jgi:hypothetical protein